MAPHSSTLAWKIPWTQEPDRQAEDGYEMLACDWSSDVCSSDLLLSHVQLLATPWTAAYHALPSMGFSRQEYWSGVPLPSPTSIHKPA